MNCQQCQNPIDPERIRWCQSKGFSVKYCKACSDARKAAKEQGAAPQAKSPDDDKKWHEIAVSKIVHNFMLEGYKLGKTPEEAGKAAAAWYSIQDQTVKFILKRENPNAPQP